MHYPQKCDGILAVNPFCQNEQTKTKTIIMENGVSFLRNCGATSVASVKERSILSTVLIRWFSHRKEIRVQSF